MGIRAERLRHEKLEADKEARAKYLKENPPPPKVTPKTLQVQIDALKARLDAIAPEPEPKPEPVPETTSPEPPWADDGDGAPEVDDEGHAVEGGEPLESAVEAPAPEAVEAE